MFKFSNKFICRSHAIGTRSIYNLASPQRVFFVKSQVYKIRRNQVGVNSIFTSRWYTSALVDKVWIDNVLEGFDKRTIDYAFAYGSGAYAQSSNVDPNNMVDLVFAVNCPSEFHKKNLKKNKSHYPFFMQLLGENVVCKIQTGFGASIYYNTLIAHQGRMIKYGVISVEDLKDDLENWKTLYVSGRLHKPVVTIKDPGECLKKFVNQNLESAVYCSLLLLPTEFTARDLYLKIAGLSYSGDFRMKFGENPKKITNIVDGNFKGFEELYLRIIENTEGLTVKKEKMMFDPSFKLKLRSLLPVNVRITMDKIEKIDLSKKMTEGDVLVQAIQKIVGASSKTQSLKGSITAGPSKSIIYIMAKLKKYFKT